MDVLLDQGKKGEYPPSVYAATAPKLAPFDPLDGAIKTDICIIGAGYAGLSAAIHLGQAGRKVVLLEAQRVGWGASGRNGGQLGSGQRVEQGALEDMLGKSVAHKLWQLSMDAKNLAKSLIAEHQIDCDLTPGIIYADHKARYVADTRDYVAKLRDEYRFDAISFLDREELASAIGTNVYFGGSRDVDAGHLHPLKYVLGLARAAQNAGVTIHEQSRAQDIARGATIKVRTEGGTVEADHLLIACNGYLGGLEPAVASRVMPINSYIVATEPLSDDRANALIKNREAVADSRFVVNYYRLDKDNRMLFGGRESYGYRYPDDIAESVKARMLTIYPQLSDLKIDYAWGGTLGITMNRMPHFTRLDENILNASGFSGHGVAMATLAGKLLAEAVQGKAEGFDLMASVPTPRFPGGRAMQRPLLVLAMLWYALRDRL